MAVRIKKVPFRRWPVTVALRECDDAGVVSESHFRFIGHFTRFTEADIQEAGAVCFPAPAPVATEQAEGTNRETEPIAESIYKASFEARAMAHSATRRPDEQAAAEAKFFGTFVCGWEAVLDGDDAPVPFTAEALNALLVGDDGPSFRRAFHVAIHELRNGVAPAKNVETSPAPGPAPQSGEAATS